MTSSPEGEGGGKPKDDEWWQMMTGGRGGVERKMTRIYHPNIQCLCVQSFNLPGVNIFQCWIFFRGEYFSGVKFFKGSTEIENLCQIELNEGWNWLDWRVGNMTHHMTLDTRGTTRPAVGHLKRKDGESKERGEVAVNAMIRLYPPPSCPVSGQQCNAM